MAYEKAKQIVEALASDRELTDSIRSRESDLTRVVEERWASYVSALIVERVGITPDEAEAEVCLARPELQLARQAGERCARLEAEVRRQGMVLNALLASPVLQDWLEAHRENTPAPGAGE